MTDETKLLPKVGDKLLIVISGRSTDKYQEVLAVDEKTGRLELGPIKSEGSR